MVWLRLTSLLTSKHPFRGVDDDTDSTTGLLIAETDQDAGAPSASSGAAAIDNHVAEGLHNLMTPTVNRRRKNLFSYRQLSA